MKPSLSYDYEYELRSTREEINNSRGHVRIVIQLYLFIGVGAAGGAIGGPVSGLLIGLRVLQLLHDFSLVAAGVVPVDYVDNYSFIQTPPSP